MSKGANWGRCSFSVSVIGLLLTLLSVGSLQAHAQATFTQVGYAATPANTCAFNYQGDYAHYPNPPTTLTSAGCNNLPTSLTVNLSPTQENSSLLLVNSGWGALGACNDNLGQQWLPDGPTITNEAGTSAIGRKPPAGATVEGITSVTCSVTFVPMSQAVNLDSATGQEGEHIIQVYEVDPAPGDKLNEQMSSISPPISACRATAATGGVAIVGFEDGDDYAGTLWSGTNRLSGSLAGANSATQTWNSNFYDLSGRYEFSYAPAYYVDGIKSASAAGGTAGLSCAQPSGYCSCFVVQFTSAADSETGKGPACSESECGEPINLANGNTYIEETDISVPGFGGGLNFARTWNSTFSPSHPTEAAGLFGPGWRSTIEERIELQDGGIAKYWRSDGSVWTFGLDTQTNTYQIIAPANQAVSFTTGSSQFTIVYQNGETRIFDGNTGSLTAIQDRNGNTTSVAYDNFNRAMTVADPAGRHLYFAYGNQNFPFQVTGVTTDVNLSLSYAYDAQGNLLSVTKPDRTHLNFQYDSNSLITAVTDDQGKILESHSYDGAGRGMSSSRANGVDNLSLIYDTAPNTVLLVDSLGNTTNYSSDLFGGKRYVTAGNGSGCSSCGMRGNTTNTYDSQGRVSSTTDAAGHTTTLTYDANGNVTSRSSPLDASTTVTWRYTYNSFADVLTSTDPLGNTTTNTYDSHGNVVSTTTPPPDGSSAGSATIFTYDQKGELLTIKSPMGFVTTLTYSPQGQVATITDAQNETTAYQYDSHGNRTSVTDALGSLTMFSYDAGDRLTQIAYPNHTTASFAYDYRGRRTSATDQNGKATLYSYDDADRLVAATDPAGNTTQYTYDTESNLSAVLDALGRNTTFTYDPFGRVTQTVFPSSATEYYVYDAVGNLINKTDRDGQTIQYLYDALNRVTLKAYPDTSSVSYQYDAASRLLYVQDATGFYHFAYDGMGRLASATTQYAFATGVFTTSYTYDLDSNRLTMTDPQGGATGYSYNYSPDRLTGISSPSGLFGFGYDALGRRTTLTRPSGIATAYGYDALSRVLNIAHQSGGATVDGASYSYDGAGNATSSTNVLNNLTSAYSYDNNYQLLKVLQGTTTPEKYTYDALGNRLTEKGVNYTYNSSNEILSKGQNISFTYDNNGNTLTKTDATGTTQYTWDFENRLVQMVMPTTTGTTTVMFKYDPFGRRIQKSGPGNTVNYLYDGANVLEQVNANGRVQARYTMNLGVDEPLSEKRGSNTYYYEADKLGSVTSMTDITGTRVNSYTYSAFGKTTAKDTTKANPYRYTGRELDSDTGLYYYRARYYDPTIGRFIGEDPVRFRAGANFYRYVGNNALNFADPLGLCAQFPKTDYCAYQGNALSPSDFAARGKAFRDEIDTMNRFDPEGGGPTFFYALGELAGDFHQGGPLDAQPRASGTPLQRASYGNYAYGAFFAGAGIPLSDALSAANAYGLKQQLLNGAYKGRNMDSSYTHLPAVNIQDITSGYTDEVQGTLCKK